MRKLVIICLIGTVLSVAMAKPSSQETASAINQINNAQKSWTAGHTHLSELSKAEMQRLLGARKPEANAPRRRVQVAANLPSEFDARQQWSNCPSINSIKDQGHCGSCWAVSTAAAATDRLCIATGNNQVNLSAENLMSCCSNCAPDGGCNGGWPDKAWSYIASTGIVTGGDYNSNDGCQPYEIPPTGSSVREYIQTPPCESSCSNNGYSVDYSNDFYYGSSEYNLNSDQSQIQTDLMNNGPLVACFDVYEDFRHYTTGVYHRTSDEYLGSHAVRVIGWGTENGEDYWLIANSWNRGFGENGLFKIRRGVDECGIEDTVSAGTMSS